MRAKLGPGRRPAAEDDALIDDLLALLHAQRVDFTSALPRAVVRRARRRGAGALAVRRARAPSTRGRSAGARGCAARARDPQAIAAAMDRVNPVYIPRNHLVEEALAAATAGDLGAVRAAASTCSPGRSTSGRA